jgi:flagellar FliL protein
MATTPEVAKPPKRTTRNILVALIAGASLCVAAAGAYVIRGGVLPAASATPKPPEKPIFVTLEPLTVNLHADSSKGRFLHIGVSLKVRDEQAQARVLESLPELRGRLLLLLSDRKPESLWSTTDKSALAGQIRDELDRPLTTGRTPHGITSVSFNAFVVQ